MKKLYYLFIVPFLLMGCAQEEIVNDEMTSQSLRAELQANDSESRVEIDGLNLAWSADDSFLAFTDAGESLNYVLTQGEGSKSATFKTSTVAKGNLIQAVYPSAINPVLVDGDVKVTLKEEINAAESKNIPMWSAVQDNRVYFMHLMGTLRINLKYLSNEYTDVVVTTDQNIAGDFIISGNKMQPMASGAKSVRVARANEELVYVSLPEANYKSIKVEATTKDNSKKETIFDFTGNKEVVCSKLYTVTYRNVNVISEAPADKVSSKGFYVLNEDWFGHDDGTINYFKKNGNAYDINYRVYRAANANQTLGTTSCYGTIWGGKMYITSKQGNRLVVVDAQTMKNELTITELGGDGRAFVGVDETKGYISLDGGIVILNLGTNQLGQKINGVSGQIGSMVYANGKVFAISNKKLYIINAKDDSVEKTIDFGACKQLTSDRNGNVILATNKGFVKMNSVTFDQELVAYPNGGELYDSWGAWNAGGFCTSLVTNELYWVAGGSMFGGGNSIFKMNLETNEIKKVYKAGKSDQGYNLEFYGAGFRIDPLSGNLVLQLKKTGWGDAAKYNYIYILNAEGSEVLHFDILDPKNESYFWFPSMPIFEDVNKPQVLLNKIELQQNATAEINLSSLVVDYDNAFGAMNLQAESLNQNIVSVSIDGGILTVVPGETKGTAQCKISVVSNGVKEIKTIEVVNE